MGVDLDRPVRQSAEGSVRVRRRGIPILRLALIVTAAAAGLLLAGCARTRKPRAISPVSSVQVVEASAPVHDVVGERWSPDPYSRGGTLLTEQVPISDTASPALYRRERVGVRSIEVPLRSSGPYLVVLYFAETAGAAPGARVFDVIAQGRQVAAVDIAAEVGPLMPYHVAFTTAALTHTLTIRFRALKGAAVLSALRITPVSPAVQLPAARLVWSEEFGGPAGAPPDPARWRHDIGHGWDQVALYTSATANASLDGHGALALAALPQTPGHGFTSARLTTAGTFAMGYGSASARVQVAGAPGVVSTFWALGADVGRVGWPRAGEIDTAEVKGAQPRVLVQAAHTHCGARPCPVVWERALTRSLSEGFHTYTVQRAPGVLIYLLDGRQTASLTSADVPRGAWVFDKRFFLILNLIVGGWGGKPAPGTHWPIEMLVDWVRVYR